MTNIKHLIFDLNEVLMNGITDLPDAIWEAVKAKVPAGDFDLRSVYSNFFETKKALLLDLFRGEKTEEEFFENFLKLGNYPLTIDELKEITRKNFWEFSHTKPILSGLKTNGYDLLLHSDHAKEWVQYVESNFSFLSFFRYKFYSSDLKYTKLEIESFKSVISKAEINPKETLFIDDMPKNLELAREAGIQYTHCYRDPVRLTRHFKNLEIKGFWEKGFNY